MQAINVDGYRKYSISQLETVVQRDTFWLFTEMQDATRMKLIYNDTYIDEDSLKKFIKWYNANYPNCAIPTLPNVNQRAYSTSHRIEIAYKTKWRCAMCDDLLTPDFAIDHIKELRHGGTDEWDNTCALCVACHAKKTRANTLKKQTAFKKEFARRAQEIETNIFDNLKCKRSKYF